MNQALLRRVLFVYLLLLVPIGWLASRFDPYQIDGDAVSYMDIADLLHAHQWSGAVNGYWNPLYPAFLALAQVVLHPLRFNELSAYYTMNFAIFLALLAAMLLFVAALDRLRAKMTRASAEPLLSLNAMRFLGLGLAILASQRELSMGKVRPDALLTTMLLAAFAMLLESLACESLLFAPLIGLFFGLAYLTKSFGLLVGVMSIAVMMLFQLWIQRRSLSRVAAGGALALVVFAAVAGPYIAALSRQKHRFDFGDTGALALAWTVSGTDQFHLEPGATSHFGSASVQLVHPETQLLNSPGIYGYRAEPYGTYPAWFDKSFFQDRVVPHIDPHRLVRRVARNLVLVCRYLLNHPEAWILLALLLLFGGRFGYTRWRSEGFWMPMIVLGLAIWALYGIVLIEERYVTLAYFVIVLPAFAALRVPAEEAAVGVGPEEPWMKRAATAMVVLVAFLALGESLRTAAETRRMDNVEGLPHAWYSKQIFGAAQGLHALGVKPGDEVACVGTTACLFNYWARLAQVRVLTEVDNPTGNHLLEELEGLPNRQQVYDVVKGQGAKVMVGQFDPAAMTGRTPASSGWVRLGETDYYALPLNLPNPAPAELPATRLWPIK
jgi:4-amino-4-deoxy-L-arabinose transferase-like glycosyltransferase